MNNKKPLAKVYIDGANMFYTQKKLGWSFDWKKIQNHIGLTSNVVEWRYYVGLKKDDPKIQSYLRYLDAIGITAFTKPLKKIKVDETETFFLSQKHNYIYKANFDVEIAADILLDKTTIDEVILFSGDSDFQYLIKKLKDVGKKVIVYSSRKTIAWELKLEATTLFYLEDIKQAIRRL